jgi:hypothetical protein
MTEEEERAIIAAISNQPWAKDYPAEQVEAYARRVVAEGKYLIDVRQRPVPSGKPKAVVLVGALAFVALLLTGAAIWLRGC